MDAKTSSETLRKRNGSFPSVESDFPTSPRSPRKAQPPVSGISNRHLQGPPGAFLTPKRPPKRCENATVRSQVSNLIPQTPREAPGKLKLPFWGSQTNVFKFVWPPDGDTVRCCPCCARPCDSDARVVEAAAAAIAPFRGAPAAAPIRQPARPPRNVSRMR